MEVMFPTYTVHWLNGPLNDCQGVLVYSAVYEVIARTDRSDRIATIQFLIIHQTFIAINKNRTETASSREDLFGLMVSRVLRVLALHTEAEHHGSRTVRQGRTVHFVAARKPRKGEWQSSSVLFFYSSPATTPQLCAAHTQVSLDLSETLPQTPSKSVLHRF